MAVLKGVKSIPSGSEVTTVTDSTDVITVAASRHPTLTHRDLALALGAELAQVRATVPHAYGSSGAPAHDLVDRLSSAATQGRMGCRRRSSTRAGTRVWPNPEVKLFRSKKAEGVKPMPSSGTSASHEHR
jgi:hypothetical protein